MSWVWINHIEHHCESWVCWLLIRLYWLYWLYCELNRQTPTRESERVSLERSLPEFLDVPIPMTGSDRTGCKLALPDFRLVRWVPVNARYHTADHTPSLWQSRVLRQRSLKLHFPLFVCSTFDTAWIADCANFVCVEYFRLGKCTPTFACWERACTRDSTASTKISKASIGGFLDFYY